MTNSFKFSFILAFVCAVSVIVAFGNVDGSENQLNLWKTMLPNTPMPKALFDALPKSDKISVHASGQATLSQKVDEFGYEPPSPSNLLKQDIATSMFFLEKDLIPGAKLNVHFNDKSQGPSFPSSLISRKMPSLTAESFPQLLSFFSVSPNSQTARVMSQTVTRCEHPNPINGRIQFCATSLAKMVTSVTSELGESKSIKAVSMPAIKTDALSPYKITSVKQLAGEESLIACHKMSFPVGIYYCHQPRGAAAYAVSLVSLKDGLKADTYAMCHHKTSDWSPEYIAFKTLGVAPGATVCHFNQLDNVIWYRG